MSKQTTAIAACAVLLLSLFWTGSTQAQGLDGGWSEIYRLSSEAGKASEASLVADQYGYVHCFWSETLFENQRTIIKYSRFDGATWTQPNDIFVASQDVNNISPFVDKQGILHVAWSEGLFGRTYYTYAPANNTLSAQNWAKPIRINVPARPVRLRVDSKGIFHILYINPTEESGVYYVRSEDKGITWSEPVWLDPDILPDHIPDSLNFELDENDGLHAVWFYGGHSENARPDWVRYAHSLDGGHTWSTFTIDKLIERSGYNLNAAGPVMIVQGQTVHVVWAAGSQAYRNYRFSKDAGLTWSAPVQIFGELQGQAGDGLTIDGAGRVHFFGQIRYPMGIYHAYWDQDRWSTPSLVYWIANEDSEDGIGNRIHAHLTLPVIRAGNQLVLTFTDGPADPNRRLFVMYRTLDDIPPLETMPTPTSIATLIPSPSPTPRPLEPTPTATATAALMNTAGVQPLGEVPKADSGLQFGLVPVLLFLGGTFIFRLWYKRRS
jgi:hypothetical protein